ncbi:MAG TPA: hypothetical protein VFQ13_14850 [Anaerolineales bacterium]|nr:hypothetical protein [Anaerolineales bacterium]
MKKFFSFLVSILFLASCQASFTVQPLPENLLLSNTPLPPGSPLDATPTPVLPTPAPVLDQQKLSMVSIENAQYYSPIWGTFALTGGVYYRTPTEPNASPDNFSTRLFGSVAYGDLNADGIEDAAVILQTHNGGNGDTKELAVLLNQNGQPYNISTVEVGSMVALEGIQVQAGIILLQGLTLGPNDPLCCPSQPMTWQFQLQNEQLTAANDPGPTPAPTSTPSSALAPSNRNNFYGIPYDSPTWLIKPLDSDHPFNILVLGVDEKCTLTINTKTNLQDLTITTDSLFLGQDTWQITRTFQGTQQMDEIYVPNIYPPEYTQAAGSNGYGYAMSGFYDSCRLAVQGILAEMQ